MTRAAADENDGFVARHLQPFHETERHKVTYVQAVRSGVETYIKARAPAVDKLPYLFFVGDLCDKSAVGSKPI